MSKRIPKAEQKSHFSRDVNSSIALQSPYMQIRVNLFVRNENGAKHLHLDPSLSPSCHMGSTPRYSVKISDPNKRDAKRKTDDREGI